MYSALVWVAAWVGMLPMHARGGGEGCNGGQRVSMRGQQGPALAGPQAWQCCGRRTWKRNGKPKLALYRVGQPHRESTN